ncbi:MAG TPA: epoxyqueuosine reductase [Halanaerobiales bacterium]|nr:epoxyqueuosine reductase [Halanaerobiales bacterium]
MEEKIKKLINNYVKDYAKQEHIESEWRKPLTAYADAKDPLFKKLKEVISPSHELPTDFLADAKTVITFFLPFTEEINKSNIKGRLSSRKWSVAYIETNQLILDLNKYVKKELNNQGYNSSIIPATHNFYEDKLISDWSHRHAAYIAGLGTFGINNMLITEKGCAGRVGSIVTDLKLKPTTRPKKEFCLYKYNGSCKVCIDRCIVDALQADPNKFNRFDCYEICLENDKYHKELDLTDVCGKCCVDLPCTTTNPVK